jgi:cob(I)alamin adenosyltransferase
MAKNIVTTKTGDDGSTGRADGSRTSKSSLQMEAIGAIDELNCFIGDVTNQTNSISILNLLYIIQDDLFVIGAKLSQDEPNIFGIPKTFSKKYINQLDRNIIYYNQLLPPLKKFILPRGSVLSVKLHIARAVARRSERTIHGFREYLGKPSDNICVYLNRLSDLLFILARYTNKNDEVIWKH